MRQETVILVRATAALVILGTLGSAYAGPSWDDFSAPSLPISIPKPPIRVNPAEWINHQGQRLQQIGQAVSTKGQQLGQGGQHLMAHGQRLFGDAQRVAQDGMQALQQAQEEARRLQQSYDAEMSTYNHAVDLFHEGEWAYEHPQEAFELYLSGVFGTNRNQVRSDVSRDWDIVVWGKEIDLAEQERLAVEVAGLPESAGAIIEDVGELLTDMFQAFESNADAEVRQLVDRVTEPLILNAISSAVRGQVPNFQFGRLELQFGMATYNHWAINRSIPDSPNTFQPFFRARVTIRPWQRR